MASHQTNVPGCELLSELYFYLWFPTGFECNNRCYWLWIAFRIVFLLMIPNMKVLIHYWIVVVNCFQNCIFTYDSQRKSTAAISSERCELLSELYFYLWFPTLCLWNWRRGALWIAFRIVFLLMIPNRAYHTNFVAAVVNCFQNCIFTYDSQP